MVIEVRTAGQLGYCSGVSKAIEKAMAYGDEHGKVYSLGTVAHNEDVVELLRQHGVEPIQVEDMKGQTYLVITAHGAPPDLYRRISDLCCFFLDCTCPIVKKAQNVVRDLAADDFDIVIFGDPGHQEVKGLMGWAMGHTKFVGNQNQLFTPGQEHKALGLGKRVGVVSQTTKVPSDYADFISTLTYHHIEGFQELRVYNTICPIVAGRIEETRKLAKEVDVMFVVGDQQSANTQNLVRVASGVMGIKPVFLVLRDGDIAGALAEAKWRIMSRPIRAGVTAGTSTPIEVVEKVVARLKEIRYGS